MQKLLRDAMVEKGYTPADVARASGVAYSTINRLLSDNPQRLSVLTAGRLQRALDIDADLYALSRSANAEKSHAKADESDDKGAGHATTQP